MLENEIEKLLDKFDCSSLTEMKVNDAKSSVYFSKQKRSAKNNDLNDAAPAINVSAKSGMKKQPIKKTSESKLSKDNGANKIKAPMVGIVYFAPDPNKPDFKKIGDHVDKGETICVIEAMKINNEIKSPVSGTITNRLVKNGAMVQYHQPVFDIKED